MCAKERKEWAALLFCPISLFTAMAIMWQPCPLWHTTFVPTETPLTWASASTGVYYINMGRCLQLKQQLETCKKERKKGCGDQFNCKGTHVHAHTQDRFVWLRRGLISVLWFPSEDCSNWEENPLCFLKTLVQHFPQPSRYLYFRILMQSCLWPQGPDIHRYCCDIQYPATAGCCFVYCYCPLLDNNGSNDWFVGSQSPRS